MKIEKGMRWLFDTFTDSKGNEWGFKKKLTLNLLADLGKSGNDWMFPRLVGAFLLQEKTLQTEEGEKPNFEFWISDDSIFIEDTFTGDTLSYTKTGNLKGRGRYYNAPNYGLKGYTILWGYDNE